jgi:hypothetical protein
MDMLKSRVFWGLAIAGLSLVVEVAPASAKEWYFWVDNHSSADITRLQVSQDKENWGYFDIGSGIGSGEQTKIVWDPSTDNERCSQWIRALFSDNTASAPTQFDFCDDLDTPIVFSDN